MDRYFDENSWKLDCVHKKETVSTLSSLVSDQVHYYENLCQCHFMSSQVLEQVFDIYCDPMEGGAEDEFSVNTEKVSRLMTKY